MTLMPNSIESYGNVTENKRYTGVFSNSTDLIYILSISTCWLIAESSDRNPDWNFDIYSLSLM